MNPIIRRCCYCELEFGLRPARGVSHGVCFRHAITDAIAGIPDTILDDYIQRAQDRYEQDPLAFSPDFAALNYDG